MTLEDPARAEPSDRLLDRLGFVFADRAGLELALTHRSWCAEHAGYASNERLEFLGDAVLGVVVTEHIFAAYPELHEGELAKLRARVVSEPVLAEVAEGLGLGDALRLGKGEDTSGGRAKPSILADALEAVIGAVHLDGGMGAARQVVLDLLTEQIVEAAARPGGHDHKTQLQELAARHFDDLPVRGGGEGRSKKQGEQEAARAALGGLVGEGTDA